MRREVVRGMTPCWNRRCWSGRRPPPSFRSAEKVSSSLIRLPYKNLERAEVELVGFCDDTNSVVSNGDSPGESSQPSGPILTQLVDFDPKFYYVACPI
ncbi:sugar transporter, partial [Dionaea muscipula]